MNFGNKKKLQALEPPMLGHVLLPLYMDDRHEVLDILNRDPRCEGFHRIFEVGVKKSFPLAINDGSTGSVQYLQALGSRRGFGDDLGHWQGWA